MEHILISLRNLLRNYKRTSLTLSILVLGVVGMLVYAGYIDFSMWGLREQTIRGGLGHIQVYKKGYSSRGNQSYLKYLMENEKEIQRLLLSTPHVQEATSGMEVRGLLSNGETSEMTMCRGYDLSSVSVIRDSYTIHMGAFPSSNDSYDIALGTGLAAKLDADIGSYLTLMTTTRDGALNAADFKVVSIIKTGVKEYDNMLSIIPIRFARSLLDVQAAEKFIVMLDKTEAVPLVTESLRRGAAETHLGIELRTWSDLADFYHRVKSMNDTYFLITQLIILVIVAFSIINTMRMVIYERMREIGTIRAIGMTRTKVVLMFLYEGVWLGLFAIIAGIIAAHAVASVINLSGGIFIPPPPGQSEGYHTMIRPNVIRYFEVSGIVMVSVIAGSLLPAFRAANIKIDEALRYV
ncbi:MAG: ABC transporter permease [Spirochaetota bacterium]